MTNKIDVYREGELAEEFGCKTGVIVPESAVSKSLMDMVLTFYHLKNLIRVINHDISQQLMS
jgi:hypothetical protein